MIQIAGTLILWYRQRAHSRCDTDSGHTHLVKRCPSPRAAETRISPETRFCCCCHCLETLGGGGGDAAAGCRAAASAFARDASDAAAIAGAPAFAGDAATGGRNPEGAEAGTIAIPVDDACTGAVAADADGLVLLMLMVAAADDAGAGAAVATADGLSPRVPRVV